MLRIYLEERRAQQGAEGSSRQTINDTVLCNVAAANATSESAAERILSALRVVCTKAYGEHASEFKYDKHLTKQAIAIGR